MSSVIRVLVAADSFKDALAAPEVCRAIAQGVRERYPQAQIVEFPLADGGEGTFDVLARHLGLRSIEVDTVDPLLRPLRAPYGLSEGGIDGRDGGTPIRTDAGTAIGGKAGTPIRADGGTAIIEMARTAGLQLLPAAQRNAARTSTLGVGMQLADACRRGVSRAVLAIGGSATNDAGMGLAHAMGWRFLDVVGAELSPIGANLLRIARILPPQQCGTPQIDVICDVNNPLYGPDGAAYVYARQKGADESMVANLDAGLQHIAARMAADLGVTGIAELPGAGAAGGVGFGAMAFLGARLRHGIELVMELTGFDAALAEADLLITGEGHLDGQTLHGKLIHGICRRAQKVGVPVIALCGRVSASEDQLRTIGLRAAMDINDIERPLPEALARTAENLRRSAARLALPGETTT